MIPNKHLETFLQFLQGHKIEVLFERVDGNLQWVYVSKPLWNEEDFYRVAPKGRIKPTAKDFPRLLSALKTVIVARVAEDLVTELIDAGVEIYDNDEIAGAFLFKSTPQGLEFWSVLSDMTKELEDVPF